MSTPNEPNQPKKPLHKNPGQREGEELKSSPAPALGSSEAPAVVNIDNLSEIPGDSRTARRIQIAANIATAVVAVVAAGTLWVEGRQLEELIPLQQEVVDLNRKQAAFAFWQSHIEAELAKPVDRPLEQFETDMLGQHGYAAAEAIFEIYGGDAPWRRSTLELIDKHREWLISWEEEDGDCDAASHEFICFLQREGRVPRIFCENTITCAEDAADH